MFRLLAYLLSHGVVTKADIPELLGEGLLGLPKVTGTPCEDGCSKCIDLCPTNAIQLSTNSIQIDRGACIGCGECTAACPSGTINNDLSTATFAYQRDALLSNFNATTPKKEAPGIFSRSLSVRVVSTGCTACDLEVSASGNAIFDMERFGVNVVASPRFADALLITGPVPKAMQEPLLICYEAMSYPKLVIACGTCAISGGIHKGGYAEANGASSLLPIDLFIPGCSPHPWQIVQGLLAAKKLKGRS